MDKNQVKKLLKAVQRGDLEVLKQMVGSWPRQDEAWKTCHFDRSGDTAVHYAARHGHCDVLRFLVESGCDVRQRNSEGKQAIHEAAQAGAVQCLSYLLERLGVEPDTLKRGDWTPLMLACTKDREDVVKVLLQHGASPRRTNKDGWNSFHLACREGHCDIIELLHEGERELWNTRSNNGRTPLHTAALHGKAGAVKWLLGNCGYVGDMSDSCGSTPLMDAVRAGFTDVANILIETHQANVTKGDNCGYHPLHLAAQAGSVKSAEFLLSRCGVPVDARADGGITPLHLAAKEGHSDVIKVLVRFGAQVCVTDSGGRTAVSIATGGGRQTTVETLLALQHGGTCTIETSHPNT